MDLKNYTQVLIDGKVYTLGGSEDESYLQKAASYVNEKNSAMRKVPGFTKQSADYQTVMTELNITDDYFKAMDHAEEMERQKNDMEKETYSLKHELVSTQMKLEAVLKDLEDRQMELDRQYRRVAELEGEIKEARETLQAFRNRPTPSAVQGRTVPEGTARIQVETTETVKETVEVGAAVTLDTDSMKAGIHVLPESASHHPAAMQPAKETLRDSVKPVSSAGTADPVALTAASPASATSGQGLLPAATTPADITPLAATTQSAAAIPSVAATPSAAARSSAAATPSADATSSAAATPSADATSSAAATPSAAATSSAAATPSADATSSAAATPSATSASSTAAIPLAVATSSAAAIPSAAATPLAAAMSSATATPSTAATQSTAATSSAVATSSAATTSAATTQAAATVVSTPVTSAGGMTDEELARKALQAARKAGSHKGGRR